MNIWIAIATALAFFLAWNLGANDVANAMGTSVGAGVITLRQAIVLAGVMELLGALLLGQEVTTTLVAGVSTFSQNAEPSVLILGMIAVLLANGLWLWIATLRGWPVASSHAAVSAIAGVSFVAAGAASIHWDALGWIGLSWILTPCLSGGIAALYYGMIRHYLLTEMDLRDRLRHWQPWLSALVAGVIGSLVLPTVAYPLAEIATDQWHWQLPLHDYSFGLGILGMWAINLWLSQSQESSELADGETLFGKLQLLSAASMALAHGSNDVGNAIAPLVVLIAQPPATIESVENIPGWVLALGGVALVSGLATLGKRVMITVGEKLMPLRPSIGFCVELAAASTVLLASTLGLPVSTTHALIGSVVGAGLVQNWQVVNWKTVREIFAAWILTIPTTLLLAITIFGGLKLLRF
jgi:inorganic phosphate transporter, PiT family